MKLKLGFATMIGLLISSAAIAQTNYKTVMVETNGTLHRPTNFWTANATNISAAIISSETFAGINLGRTFARARFTTSFAGVATSLTNASAGIEVGWLSIVSNGTNATAAAHARLLRAVLASEAAGAGLQFQNVNYKLVVDLGVYTVTTNNVARVVLGNDFTEMASPLTDAGIGFEIRSGAGGTNEIRIVAHNGTNGVSSAYIPVGYLSRQVVAVESRTNGTVFLYNASGNTGQLPVVLTNITGGPQKTINAGQANVHGGLFITATNAVARSVTFYACGVEMVD